MNERVSKMLQFISNAYVEGKRRAVNDHDRMIASEERYWNMISAVDCMKELNADRNRMAELLSKYYDITIENAIHFLAEYDIQDMNKKRAENG